MAPDPPEDVLLPPVVVTLLTTTEVWQVAVPPRPVKVPAKINSPAVDGWISS